MSTDIESQGGTLESTPAVPLPEAARPPVFDQTCVSVAHDRQVGGFGTTVTTDKLWEQVDPNDRHTVLLFSQHPGDVDLMKQVRDLVWRLFTKTRLGRSMHST